MIKAKDATTKWANMNLFGRNENIYIQEEIKLIKWLNHIKLLRIILSMNLENIFIVKSKSI